MRHTEVGISAHMDAANNPKIHLQSRLPSKGPRYSVHLPVKLLALRRRLTFHHVDHLVIETQQIYYFFPGRATEVPNLKPEQRHPRG